MPERTDVTYVYDGSLQGLLCCIFESFQKKEQPVDIQTNDTAQMTLYMKKVIDTDNTKADRVRDGIIRMASADAYDMVEYGFHSCHPQKERLILRFVYLAMEHGSKALCMLTNETVETLVNAVNALLRESEKLKGFVRFSDLIEACGYKAIATTSMGIAASLGYPDCQVIQLSEMIGVISGIVNAVQVPVTVDIEAGYGNNL